MSLNVLVSLLPGTQVDLMVDELNYAQVVSYIQRINGTYVAERTAKPVKKGHIYHVLKDVQTGSAGVNFGELMGLIYKLADDVNTEDDCRLYVMVHPKRKEKKKDAGKDRKETGEGCDGGDSGESAGYSESGTVGEPAGDGDGTRSYAPDGVWVQPNFPEAAASDGDSQ